MRKLASGRNWISFVICIYIWINQNHAQAAEKRRYFKSGGNWKSQRDQPLADWSKSPTSGTRRSLADVRSPLTSARDVPENTEVELTCTVDRQRFPRVQWTRIGKALPDGAHQYDNRLYFRSIRLQDAGTYVCTATNGWDTKEVHIRLTVRPEERHRESVATLGHCRIDQAVCKSGECIDRDSICDGDVDCRDGSDEHNCGADRDRRAFDGPGRDCEPNEFKCNSGKCMQLMWRCDGDDDCGDNSDEQNCGQRAPGELCAPYEFKCHAQSQCIPMAYQCDKRNDCFDGSDEFGCVAPSVVEPPQRDVSVRCGETIVLTCRTVGVPVPYVNWRLNWGPVCGPPRCTQTSVNGLGTLTIRNAMDIDQGAYTCEAVNVVDRLLVTPDAIVRVDCLPVPVPAVALRVSVTPPFQEADERTTVSFRCLVDGGSGGPYTYTWTRAGYTHLPYNARPAGDTLTIQDVHIENYGTYMCSVTSARGESGNAQGELKVRRVDVCPYVWIEPDNSQCGPDGSRIEFVCKAIGEPPARLHWARADGRPFDSNVADYGDGRLVITNVSPKDYGVYVCTGENRAGKNLANATVCEGGPTHPSRHPLQVRIEPSNRISSRRYDTVDLRCVGIGDGPITLTWTREDGQPLASNVQDLGNGMLRFVSIDDHNMGEYRCTGRNPSEQAYDIATVLQPAPPIRQVPPQVRIDPREIVGQVGDPGQFVCTATGDPRDPPPTLKWGMKGGQPVPAGVEELPGGVLRFPGLQQHHVGMYECLASTPFGVGTATAPVRISVSGHPPSTPIVTPPYIVTGIGDRITIYCRSTGDPPPALRWGFNTADTPLRPGIRLTDDGTLVIDGVQQSDEGLYFCTATNHYGRAISAPATVRIEQPPVPPIPPTHPPTGPNVWITPTDHWSGRPGDDFEFQCHGSGDPPPQLSWSREDGRPLGQNVQELGGSRLHLSRVTPAEAGRYICTAYNLYGTATAPATVAVEGGPPPTPQVIPPTQQVPAGSPAQFQCIAQGSPPPTLSWGFQSERGPLRPGVQAHDGTLYIDRVTKEDAGQYICTASNPYGSSSAPGDLQVMKPPTLRIDPGPLWPGEPDKSHTFTCVSVDDPEARLSWRRADGRPLDPNVQDLGDGRLSIDQYKPENDGEYICTGTSPSGTAEEPARIEPAKMAPPVPEVTPKIQTLPEGDTAEFECTVEGVPPPTLTWGYGTPTGPLKGNARVEQDGKRLIVSNVQQEDEGKYFCVASNPHGSNSAPGTLYIEKASQPPKVTITPTKEWKGRPGDDFTFQCTATGYPEPSVTWTREEDTDFDSNVVTDEEGHLSITSARRLNQGRYICTGKNEAGEDTDSAVVDIQSDIEVQIYYQGKLAPPVIHLPEGVPFELECRGTGDPEPEIGWTVDMGPSRGDVPEGYKPVEIYNEFVRHDAFSRANEGIYICNGTNEFGTDQALVRLVAATGGKRDVVILGGSERPTQLGTRVELKCVISDAGPKYDLRWARTLPSGETVPIPSRQPTPGTYVIQSFAPDDAGVYQCQAYDQDANAVVSTADVNVSVFGEQDALHVVEIEGDRVQSLNMGQSLELTCSTEGEPQDSQSQLVWQVLDKGGFRPVTKGTSTNGRLSIPNVQLDDAGIYSCVRYIGEERDGANQVTVLVSNTELTAEKKLADVGYAVELQCPLYRVSGMSYRWRRVNQPRLPTGAQVDGHFLRIPNFKPDVAGTYECEGRLNGARARGYIQVVPEGGTRLAAILRPVPPVDHHKSNGKHKKHESQDQRNRYHYYQSEQPTQYQYHEQKPAAIQASKPYMELAMEVSPDFVFPGQDVTFRCKVDGDANARIRWDRANGPLPRTAQVNGNELRLRKVHKGDTGRYRCHATTKIGEMTAHANLKLGHKITGNILRRYYRLRT